MTVDADGWLDWTQHAPGIPDKIYTQRNSGELGIAEHSIVGSYQAALNRFMSTARNPDGSYTDAAAASVQFINCKDGTMLQCYSVHDSTWTSGGRIANCGFWSVETEGGPPSNPGEPLTTGQQRNMLRLIEEYKAIYGRMPVLLEHGQIARIYGYAPTACASGRYAVVNQLALEEGLSVTDKELLTALANIVCRNGMRVFRNDYTEKVIDWSKYTKGKDDMYLIAGDDAIEYSKVMGFSFALGLQDARDQISNLGASAPGAGTANIDIDALAITVAKRLEIGLKGNK